MKAPSAGAVLPGAQTGVAAHLAPVFEAVPIGHFPLQNFAGQFAQAYRQFFGCGGFHFLGSGFEFDFQRRNEPAQGFQQVDHDRGQLRAGGLPNRLPPPFALDVLAVIQSVAASLCGQALALALETLPLPRDAPLLFLLGAGNPDHTEGVMVATDIAVQVQGQLLGVAFVGLDLLAVLIPVAWPHHVVGNSHLL